MSSPSSQFRFNPLSGKLDLTGASGSSPPGEGITINGDTGTRTGSIFNFTASPSGFDNNSTSFSVSSSTVTLEMADGNGNLFIGSNAGSPTVSGSGNVGLGMSSMQMLTTGNNNFSVGSNSLQSATTASENICFGAGSLGSIVSGIRNVSIGTDSGNNYSSSESYNILLGNSGIAGEAYTMRLGDPSSIFSTYIAGISGAVVGSPVLVGSDGRLGLSSGLTAGNVLMGTGGVSSSFQPLPSKATNVLSNVGTTISNVTGGGELYIPIIFEAETYDLGNNYDSTTGVFTAPRDGTYLISATVTMENLDSTHTSGTITAMIGAVTFKETFNPAAVRGSSNSYSHNITRVCNMLAAQTAYIGVQVSGGATQVGVEGDDFGYYSSVNFVLIS